MGIINAASFVESSESPYLNGTVEATVNGKTRRVPAHQKNGEITAYRIAGKYQTGTKVWSCHVTLDIKTGRERFGGGFDNRATRSRIQSLVGFMDEINEVRHSQR